MILYLTQLIRLGVEVIELVLVLARNVPAHGVVARECARAIRTRRAYALVTLSDVRAQVGFVAVEPLAVRTLELLTRRCGGSDGAFVSIGNLLVRLEGRRLGGRVPHGASPLLAAGIVFRLFRIEWVRVPVPP